METSQLICTNQLTGFYIIGNIGRNKLKHSIGCCYGCDEIFADVSHIALSWEIILRLLFMGANHFYDSYLEPFFT